MQNTNVYKIQSYAVFSGLGRWIQQLIPWRPVLVVEEAGENHAPTIGKQLVNLIA
jgi:hypothetical protein